MKAHHPIFLILFIINACNSNEEPTPVEIFNTSLLTNQSGWKIISIIKETDEDFVNLFNNYTECVKDNVYFFEPNEAYQILEGKKKCVDADPELKEQGIWKLEKGKLLMVTPSDSVEFYIYELSDNKLQCAIIEIPSKGIVGSVTTYSFVTAGAH